MKKKNLLIYFISFILPIVLFLYCCIIKKIFPFGEKTILISDLAVQYSSMFLFYKRLFSDGASILYSFGAAGGTPILDMFSYYLASPFNLILLLFPVANITEGILTLLLLKLGLSGVTFSVLLLKKFHKSDFTVVAFSVCYALMGWVAAYFYNIMWLDALIWLPIIILGIERVFARKKPLTFYLSLTIAIFSNWYTGYMLCLFSGIYSLYVVFRRKFNKKQLKERLKVFFKMCLYGVLAVTTCAVMLLPAFLSLKNHEKTEISNVGVNFEILDICSKFLVGASDFGQITNEQHCSTYENLPIVYCGVSMLFLAIIYFFNSKIRKQEKIASGIVLLVIFFSFYINIINSIWHGFNGCIWYPYRYSFVFSFFILLLAYKSWRFIEYFDKKKLLKILGIVMLIVTIIEQLNYSYIQKEDVFFTLSILFGTCLLLYFIVDRKAKLNIIFSIFVSFEIFVNLLFNINVYDFYDRNLYYNLLNTSEKAFNEIQEDGFYRVLVDDHMAYNLGLAYGYNSLNFTSSTVNEVLKRTFQKFEGIEDFENHILLFPNMPIRNMLFGNKYSILFDKNDSKYILNKQEKSLNIGFLVDKKIMEMNLDEANDEFEFQNSLISHILNRNVSCYKPIDYQEKVLENIIEEEKAYRLMDEYSSISYILKDVKEAVYVQFFNMGYVEVYVNGILQNFERNSRRSLVVESDSSNELEIKFVFSEKGWIDKKDPVFYQLNQKVFEKVYEELKVKEVELKSFSNTYITAEILNKSDNKLLFLSIPNDGNWHVYVNGEKTDVNTVLESFMAIEMFDGRNEIKLIYFPFSLIIGGLMSVFSIMLVIFFQKKLK